MKYKILILMLLVMLPVAFMPSTVFASDFSDNYFQKRIYTGTAQDSELLRSTYTNTGINVDDVSYGFCSVAAGGSRFNSLPVTISDSNTGYDHNSLIVPYNTTIVQYGTDCSVLDTYTITDGYIISNIGYTGAYYDGSDLILPTFAVTKYDTGDGKTYMMMFTLDSETSKLSLTSEVLIETGLNDADETFGVAGGCYASNNVVCSLGNRVFGVFSTSNDKLYTVGYTSSWIKKTQVTVGETYIDAVDNKNMLFFRDYDDDGFNEFLLFGSYVLTNQATINRREIQPLAIAPFYIDNGNETEHIMNSGTGVAVNNNVQYQSITPCQIGAIDGELETCFSINVTDGGTYKIITGWLPNPYSGYSTFFGQGGLPPFTYDVDGTISYDRYVCIPITTAGTYRCYSDDGISAVIEETFTLDDTTNMDNQLRLEVLVTEADGDTSSPEILFSNGEMENINLSGTNTPATDWASLDDTYYGSFFAQDLSNDGKSEIVYIDEDTLRIYSMDNTPFAFENYTNVSGTTTTTPDTGFGVDVTIEEGIPYIFSSLQTNIMSIMGIVFILIIVAGIATYTTNPLVLMLAGIGGAVISALLGLLSTGILVIMIISMVILIIAGAYFKSNNG